MNYTGFSDDELVSFAKQGNSESFNELVNRYLKKILTTATGILRNEQDAEDAAQEIFTLAWARIRLFRSESKFSTWLYQVARNYCIDIKRSKKRQPVETVLPPEDEAENGRGKTPLQHLTFKESEGKIKGVLRHLTKRQQKIVALKEDDATIKEIANKLRCSLATVKRDLLKIKEVLETKLEQ